MPFPNAGAHGPLCFAPSPVDGGQSVSKMRPESFPLMLTKAQKQLPALGPLGMRPESASGKSQPEAEWQEDGGPHRLSPRPVRTKS